MLAALAAALALAGPPSPAEPQPPAAPRPRTVSGTMAAVALPDRKVTLEAPEGPLVLALDRNTLVFLAARLGTVQDLAAGQAVRAGVGPKGEAFWIEVLPQGAIPEASPAPTPAATPGPAPAPGATSPPAAAPLPPPAPGSAPGAAPTLAPNR